MTTKIYGLMAFILIISKSHSFDYLSGYAHSAIEKYINENGYDDQNIDTSRLLNKYREPPGYYSQNFTNNYLSILDRIGFLVCRQDLNESYPQYFRGIDEFKFQDSLKKYNDDIIKDVKTILKDTILIPIPLSNTSMGAYNFSSKEFTIFPWQTWSGNRSDKMKKNILYFVLSAGRYFYVSKVNQLKINNENIYSIKIKVSEDSIARKISSLRDSWFKNNPDYGQGLFYIVVIESIKNRCLNVEGWSDKLTNAVLVKIVGVSFINKVEIYRYIF